MSSDADNGKPFTGRHMLGVLFLFFGTIITVNLIMAYYANTTWSGLVVKNSYVASQEFNGKVDQVKAQEVLGFRGKLSSGNGKVAWLLTDKSGAPVAAESVTVLLRRPVTETGDRSLNLARNSDGTWATKHTIEDGLWIAVIDAATRDTGVWRETIRFSVVNGVIK